MPIASLVFASLAALLHVFFWVLESLRWQQPATWRRFGAKSQAEADAIGPMAYNQGFYNLFLALGAIAGIGFAIADRLRGDGWTLYAPLSDDSKASLADLLRLYYVGNTLIAFTMLCMLGAALVLVISNRKMARAAAIQGGAPALALLIALVA